jgi:hypothetical protein
MEKRSKADIKAAIEKLKAKPTGQSQGNPPPAPGTGKLTAKQSSQRIRKQGV